MEKEDRHGTDRERDLAADLRRLLDAGIIDTEEAARLLEKADEMKKEKIEKEHNRKIFQSGGYWMTYYRDEAGKQHRIKRKTKKEVCAVLEEILYPRSPQVKAVFTEWNDSRLKLGHIVGSTHLAAGAAGFRHHREGMGRPAGNHPGNDQVCWETRLAGLSRCRGL